MNRTAPCLHFREFTDSREWSCAGAHGSLRRPDALGLPDRGLPHPSECGVVSGGEIVPAGCSSFCCS